MSDLKRINDLEEFVRLLNEEGSPYADLLEGYLAGWRADVDHLLALLTLVQEMPTPEHRTGFTNLTDEWVEWDWHRLYILDRVNGERG